MEFTRGKMGISPTGVPVDNKIRRHPEFCIFGSFEDHANSELEIRSMQKMNGGSLDDVARFRTKFTAIAHPSHGFCGPMNEGKADLLLSHAEDPDGPMMIERVRTWNRMYHEHGRSTLGFGFYLLKVENEHPT